MGPLSSEIVSRSGRQFLLRYGKVGEATGWILLERASDGGWEFVDGAFRTKNDARERAAVIAETGVL